MYVFIHSINRMSDAFYWPLVDLLLWGLTISYVKSFSPHAENIVFIVISGILFWLIVWRGQYEISVNLLEELWSRNLVNMFVSPLKFSEWIVSTVLLSFIKAFFSVTFAAIVAYFLYHVRLFYYGFYLIPFMILLFMTGWWIGFIVAGCILRWGTKVEQFAWSLVYVIAPFSVAYFPMVILPTWAQKIAMLVPTSYVFESVREVIYKGTLDPSKLLISFILNVIYLIASLIFLHKSFKCALKKGLAKVY